MPRDTDATTVKMGRKYELRDVKVKFLAAVVLGLSLLTMTGMAVSLWFFNAMTARPADPDSLPSPLANTLSTQPPEPRLQVSPGAELTKYKSQEEPLLHQYAWIDSRGGIVRIPIERAIDILAERGLPARTEESQAPPPATARTPAKKGTR